jgi:hypothetical protein
LHDRDRETSNKNSNESKEMIITRNKGKRPTTATAAGTTDAATDATMNRASAPINACRKNIMKSKRRLPVPAKKRKTTTSKCADDSQSIPKKCKKNNGTTGIETTSETGMVATVVNEITGITNSTTKHQTLGIVGGSKEAPFSIEHHNNPVLNKDAVLDYNSNANKEAPVESIEFDTPMDHRDHPTDGKEAANDQPIANGHASMANRTKEADSSNNDNDGRPISKGSVMIETDGIQTSRSDNIDNIRT